MKTLTLLLTLCISVFTYAQTDDNLIHIETFLNDVKVFKIEDMHDSKEFVAMFIEINSTNKAISPTLLLMEDDLDTFNDLILLSKEQTYKVFIVNDNNLTYDITFYAIKDFNNNITIANKEYNGDIHIDDGTIGFTIITNEDFIKLLSLTKI